MEKEQRQFIEKALRGDYKGLPSILPLLRQYGIITKEDEWMFDWKEREGLDDNGSPITSFAFATELVTSHKEWLEVEELHQPNGFPYIARENIFSIKTVPPPHSLQLTLHTTKMLCLKFFKHEEVPDPGF